MKRKSFPEAMHEIENNPDIKTREQLIAEGVVTAELMGTESDEKAIGMAEMPEVKEATPARQRKKSGTPSTSSTSAAASAIAKSAASMLANTPDSTPARSTGRGAKRKAEDTPAATPPPAKQRAEMGTPASAPTSRSGRVIKQKKFLDDQDNGGEQPLTPTAGSASKRGAGTPASSQKEQRKMWVQVK